MGLTLLADAARLKRIAAILQEGADAPPLPAALDLLARAIRPALGAGTLAALTLAFVDPARYLAGMAALAATPWPVALAAVGTILVQFLRLPPGKDAKAPGKETG
ncbi:hypothetical protein [Gemmobacter serpentinus]|uniref:hypothetical protein n=1 Tax=Gemmobacter serpentinus TaxID=2652247 RepID=UPI00124C4B54|nr:hypothetical protein [Gemmobacter serpentinus]